VTNGNYEDNELVILDPADDAVVADAVAPEADEISFRAWPNALGSSAGMTRVSRNRLISR
jgi:hypothetical protein